MREDGQMIVLTGIIVCLFVIVIVICLNTVGESSAATEDRVLSRDVVDNVLWAQEACLGWHATATTGYTWDQRYKAANAFRAAAAPALEALERDMLRRGIAYSFTCDDSSARAYITEHPENSLESVGGIIVQNERGAARIAGCSYQVRLSDGATEYAVSRVIIW